VWQAAEREVPSEQAAGEYGEYDGRGGTSYSWKINRTVGDSVGRGTSGIPVEGVAERAVPGLPQPPPWTLLSQRPAADHVGVEVAGQPLRRRQESTQSTMPCPWKTRAANLSVRRGPTQ
jgi:hypothetical protein